MRLLLSSADGDAVGPSVSVGPRPRRRRRRPRVRHRRRDARVGDVVPQEGRRRRPEGPGPVQVARPVLHAHARLPGLLQEGLVDAGRQGRRVPLRLGNGVLPVQSELSQLFSHDLS